jgi:O-antigen/teichoic acid export membrane protein
LFQIALGRLAQVVMMVLTLKVATSFLSPFEMGRVFLIGTIVSFFTLSFINPVGMFLNRRLHAWDVEGSVRHFLNYFWLYLLLISLIAVAIVVTLIKSNFIDPHGESNLLLILIFLSLIITPVNQVVIPNLNLLGYRILFIYLSVATVGLSLIIASLIIFYMQPKAELWLFGILIGQFFVSIFGWNSFYKIINKPPESKVFDKLYLKDIKVVWRFAWPIFVCSGFSWIQSQGYRFYMAEIFGLTNLGLFVAGYGVSAGIMSAAESVLSTYFQPTFYKDISDANKDQQELAWAAYAEGVLPSLILACSFIAALSPELTKMFLGEGFKGSSTFIVWGCFAELFRLISYVYGMAAHAKMRTHALIFPNIVGAIVVFFTALLSSSYLGLNGIGLALAISSLALFIATYLSVSSNFLLLLPYSKLMKCILVGLFTQLLVYFFRNILLIGSLGILISISALYALMLFLLLRPYLKMKKFNLENYLD